MGGRMGPIQLTIDSLLLDSANPRIEIAENQRQALQKILDDQEEKLYNLAESIVEDGLSPIERLLVVSASKNPKRYVALEGNRRVAALKILFNPTILSGIEVSASMKKRFEVLAAMLIKSSVEPIEAFQVASREEGNRWIYLRHTGENEGRGVVGWTGVAAARFRGEAPALQALEFVKQHGGLGNEHQELLGHYFPITTLTRLLMTPAVRKLIGVSIVDNKLTTGLPAEEAMKPLRRLVLDLAEKKVNVTALKSRDQQVEYIQELSAEDKPDLAKAGPGRPIDSLGAADFGFRAATKPPKSGRSGVVGRKTVASTKFRPKIDNSKIFGILKELKGLKAETFPNSGAVLLRVFLELSVDHFLQEKNIPLKIKVDPNKAVDKKLQQKVKEAIDFMVASQDADRKTFLSVSRGLTVASSPFSVDLLHAYVHNRFVTPKSQDLISAWDDAQPFFGQLWK
jgi:hypothetical protein